MVKIDLSQLNRAGSGSGSLPTSPSGRRSSIDLDPQSLREFQQRERDESLFHSGSPRGGGCTPRGGSAFSGPLSPSSGVPAASGGPRVGLPPAVAAKSAAAAFGMSSRVGGSHDTMQLGGNAAQVVAQQRRASAVVPDSMSQEDIMSR